MMEAIGVAVIFVLLISGLTAQQNDKKKFSLLLTEVDVKRYEEQDIRPDFVDFPARGNQTKDPDTDDLSSCLHQYLQVDNITSDYYDDPKRLPKNSCARECGGKPRICYYRFHLEPYTTMGRACGSCHINSSQCLQPQCVPADGYEKGILTVNRVMPAPSIQVCVGDLIVVDILNLMPGKSTTIHWHGMRMKTTPFMDGVPMVTQCPILEATTFRYTFRAEESGLYFYHAHEGLQKVDGIVGSLVVREAKKKDPNSNQYDFSLFSHVVLVQDWHRRMADEMHPGLRMRDLGQEPVTYLINGRGQFILKDGTPLAPTPLAVFKVTKGQRYVFHIISGTCFSCQYVFSIENHNLTVIRADVRPCKPYVVKRMTMCSGERYTVVVNASQPIGAYWMSVHVVGGCARNVTSSAYQLAILQYKGASPTPASSRPTFKELNTSAAGTTFASVNSKCNEEDRKRFGPCIDDLRDVQAAPSKITKKYPDVIMVWGLGFYLHSKEELFRQNTFHQFLQSPGPAVVSTINGIKNMMTRSPLLTQYKDVPKDDFCPKEGYNASTWNLKYRECVHVMELPANKVVEIIVMDLNNHSYTGISHSVHLHGYHCHVMECGPLDRTNPHTTLRKLLNYLGSKNRRPIPVNPVTKDTFAVSSGGYCILRILTDNIGFWYFHCHFAYHLESGMNGIIQVGDVKDFLPPPKGFPKCGNYLPEPSCP